MTHKFDPRTYYLALCKEVTDEFCLDMLKYMIENDCIGYNSRVSRSHLANALLGKVTTGNDRKIRKAKETLNQMGFPMLSSSGAKGYYLAEYQDEIDEYTIENNHRIASLMAQNNAINRVKLPYVAPSKSKQTQPPLWSGR
jgi:hypothetical protein